MEFSCAVGLPGRDKASQILRALARSLDRERASFGDAERSRVLHIHG